MDTDLRAPAKSTTRFLSLAFALLTLSVAAATAQQAPPALEPEPQQAPQPEVPLLSGPPVKAANTAEAGTTALASLTITEFSLDGRLQPIEHTYPELAAIDLLPLSETEHKAALAVAADRQHAVERIVGQNTNLLLEFASSAGDRAAQMEILGRAYTAMRPVRDRRPLVDELADAINPEHARELRRMVDEYHRAERDHLVRDAKLTEGKDVKPFEARIRQNIHAMGRELRLAFERIVTEGEKDLEAFLSKLALRPEQDATIRRLIVDFVVSHGLNATPEAKRGLFFAVLRELDRSQKAALLRLALRGDL